MYLGANADNQAPWLMVVFSIPAKRASARVEVWRRLRKYGAVALRGGGHLLPASADNRERLEWLSETVRRIGGESTILQVHTVDGLPEHKVRRWFVSAREKEYAEVMNGVKELDRPYASAAIARLRRRFQDIVTIDPFGGPMQKKAEQMLAALEAPQPTAARSAKIAAKDYRNRVWLTRPRPGIDRVASAWLIVNHIDPKARFRFASDPAEHPDAVPFDMYQRRGFGHRGNDCTFETLVKDFQLKGKALVALAEMIHDADIKDEKFGRTEAIGVEKVLKGWAKQGMKDEQLLKRGMELIDGLVNSQ